MVAPHSVDLPPHWTPSHTHGSTSLCAPPLSHLPDRGAALLQCSQQLLRHLHVVTLDKGSPDLHRQHHTSHITTHYATLHHTPHHHTTPHITPHHHTTPHITPHHLPPHTTHHHTTPPYHHHTTPHTTHHTTHHHTTPAVSLLTCMSAMDCSKVACLSDSASVCAQTKQWSSPRSHPHPLH